MMKPSRVKALRNFGKCHLFAIDRKKMIKNNWKLETLLKKKKAMRAIKNKEKHLRMINYWFDTVMML